MAAWKLPTELASWIVQMSCVLDRRIQERLLAPMVALSIARLNAGDFIEPKPGFLLLRSMASEKILLENGAATLSKASCWAEAKPGLMTAARGTQHPHATMEPSLKRRCFITAALTACHLHAE